ncbi:MULTISPECIES: hypothetical protein [unclassified Frankia]|uniref:hypothetical protein n=1 Tax=unclassified Frankia TaxID=2632575 RepID=UPI002AD3138C|nr:MULTISPECIES: hypothetical protein [unclassified Frankia]
MIARTREAIDLVTLRRAVQGAAARYPMARARMRTGLLGRRWSFPDVADIPIITASGHDDGDLWDAFAGLCSRPFALSRVPAVRVLHMRLPEDDALAVAAHHVALDGLSVAMLLHAILERCVVLEPRVALEPRVVTRTRRPRGTAVDNLVDGGVSGSATARGDICGGGIAGGGIAGGGIAGGDIAGGDACAGLPRHRRRAAPSMERISRLVPGVAPLRQPVQGRIAPAPGLGRANRTSPNSRACVYGVYCMAVPVPKPGRSATGGTVTVNDLLLAAAAAAVEQWNTAAGRETGRLRVRMPINLRDRDGEVALGNHTGDAVIAMTPLDRRDPETLLAAVCRQTAANKAAGPPAETGNALRGTAWLPGPARHALLRVAATVARPLLMPTASVTNLGRLPGRLTSGADTPRITSLYFAAFAGLPQGLVITATGYGDDLNLAFCYHRDLFDQSAVRRFAALYRVALDDLTRVPEPRT